MGPSCGAGRQGVHRQQAWALSIQARALAAVDPRAARAVSARALQLAEGSEMIVPRLHALIAAAEVALAGSPAERKAGAALAARALDEARRVGLVELALDAELTLGRLDAAAGRGHARLEAARRDAAARGYLLLARD